MTHFILCISMNVLQKLSFLTQSFSACVADDAMLLEADVSRCRSKVVFLSIGGFKLMVGYWQGVAGDDPY